MPTNLPPDYYEIEEQYRAATSTPQKIAYLEEMLSVIPKHKGTDKLRAELRRKLAKLKESSESQKGGSRQTSPYHIDREGAGQVVIIGPPNVGKSSLVKALTNANPEIASYPYTTQLPIPGMMSIENIQVQLIDTPPLSKEVEDAQLLDMIRRCDLILLVIDLQGFPMSQLEESLEVLTANRIIPEPLRSRFPEGRRLVYKPLLVLVNKTDDEIKDEDYEVLCELLGTDNECPLLSVSALTERNLDQLRQMVFDKLGVVRIYAKPPGQDPDYSAPFVLKRGSTVEEFAGRLHKDFLENLKSARIWGSATHDGQKVGRDHVLQEGDVVELKA